MINLIIFGILSFDINDRGIFSWVIITYLFLGDLSQLMFYKIFLSRLIIFYVV